MHMVRALNGLAAGVRALRAAVAGGRCRVFAVSCAVWVAMPRLYCVRPARASYLPEMAGDAVSPAYISHRKCSRSLFNHCYLIIKTSATLLLTRERRPDKKGKTAANCAGFGLSDAHRRIALKTLLLRRCSAGAALSGGSSIAHTVIDVRVARRDYDALDVFTTSPASSPHQQPLGATLTTITITAALVTAAFATAALAGAARSSTASRNWSCGQRRHGQQPSVVLSNVSS